MEIGRVYTKKESIVTRKIMDETILVPISGDVADMRRLFSLNPVGEFIWEQLDGKTTLKDIIKRLQDAFEVGDEIALADTTEFINDLLNANLIAGE